jgi:hypothetical protein
MGGILCARINDLKALAEQAHYELAHVRTDRVKLKQPELA